MVIPIGFSSPIARLASSLITISRAVPRLSHRPSISLALKTSLNRSSDGMTLKAGLSSGVLPGHSTSVRRSEGVAPCLGVK